MKKLIIVCEEKYRKYGDYLAQLISLDDDIEDEIIGTRDGEVVAQVWLEKEYQANSAQLSSNQYIIFVGTSKLVKEKSTHMKVIFSQYGMTYGWLGKQAVLTVIDTVTNNDYDEFLKFALSYQPDLEQLIEKKAEKKLIENKPDKGKLGIAVLADNVAEVLAPISEVNIIKKRTLSNKVKEQQYSCITRKFYLSSLSEFLGM